MVRWALVAVIAVVVAFVFGPRWVIAPLVGYLIYRVGTGMLAGMAADADATPPAPKAITKTKERTVYTCGECGTEVVLVVRGEEAPPRHCGERMQPRTEIPRQ